MFMCHVSGQSEDLSHTVVFITVLLTIEEGENTGFCQLLVLVIYQLLCLKEIVPYFIIAMKLPV